ncbi:hypothetical protein BJ508DRAFT_313450 [Ascobolus immersus RN42]|uniref:Uncharacterized protein n=1 Tax=Ascobolus immersus RN42 TaxID=1160509 RepID=A0A3N4HIP6_ASCIM|nr:hypothetical protein BJ508DRAFT_313450 [Ascobolus immersus RN42]
MEPEIEGGQDGLQNDEGTGQLDQQRYDFFSAADVRRVCMLDDRFAEREKELVRVAIGQLSVKLPEDHPGFEFQRLSVRHMSNLLFLGVERLLSVSVPYRPNIIIRVHQTWDLLMLNLAGAFPLEQHRYAEVFLRQAQCLVISICSKHDHPLASGHPVHPLPPAEPMNPRPPKSWMLPPKLLCVQRLRRGEETIGFFAGITFGDSVARGEPVLNDRTRLYSKIPEVAFVAAGEGKGQCAEWYGEGIAITILRDTLGGIPNAAEVVEGPEWVLETASSFIRQGSPPRVADATRTMFKACCEVICQPRIAAVNAVMRIDDVSVLRIVDQVYAFNDKLNAQLAVAETEKERRQLRHWRSLIKEPRV